MSRIIQPIGRIEHQILIEMDAKGTTKIKAVHLSLAGQEIPMGPLELTAILSQLVSSTLQVLNKPRKVTNSDGQEAKDNHD